MSTHVHVFVSTPVFNSSLHALVGETWQHRANSLLNSEKPPPPPHCFHKSCLLRIHTRNTQAFRFSQIPTNAYTLSFQILHPRLERWLQLLKILTAFPEDLTPIPGSS